jgi:large-conductance mechanosensitive channel
MSYSEFIKKNVTVNLLISVIVYGLFSNILELITTPLLDIMFMDRFDLEKLQVKIKGKNIKYGLVINQIITSLILLSLIYFFQKF